MALQTYDLGLDAMRDITQEDVDRWRDMEAAQGVFIPLQRALIVASRRLWNGEITLDQLRAAARPFQDLCEVDHSGFERGDPRYCTWRAK